MKANKEYVEGINDVLVDFHVGELIKAKLKECERSESWLARKVYCDRGNFHRVLKRKSIDMDLLERISIVMNYNFCFCFSEYVQKRIENTLYCEDDDCFQPNDL